MIHGILFSVQKMAVSWPSADFAFVLLKTLFYSVLGVALFEPSCQKGFCYKHAKTAKMLTDNWKFLLVLFGFVFVVFPFSFGMV